MPTDAGSRTDVAVRLDVQQSDRFCWFGYALDLNRELDRLNLARRDKGRFVAGAIRKINGQITLTGENSHDLFGARKSLMSAYGVGYPEH